MCEDKLPFIKAVNTTFKSSERQAFEAALLMHYITIFCSFVQSSKWFTAFESSFHSTIKKSECSADNDTLQQLLGCVKYSVNCPADKTSKLEAQFLAVIGAIAHPSMQPSIHPTSQPSSDRVPADPADSSPLNILHVNRQSSYCRSRFDIPVATIRSIKCPTVHPSLDAIGFDSLGTSAVNIRDSPALSPVSSPSCQPSAQPSLQS